jgi:hypothetical protein
MVWFNSKLWNYLVAGRWTAPERESHMIQTRKQCSQLCDIQATFALSRRFQINKYLTLAITLKIFCDNFLNLFENHSGGNLSFMQTMYDPMWYRVPEHFVNRIPSKSPLPIILESVPQASSPPGIPIISSHTGWGLRNRLSTNLNGLRGC